MKTAIVIILFLSSFDLQVQSQDSLGPCTCDLTKYMCDLNCCCDPDCSLEDKQTFSTCISTYKYENVQSCSQAAVLYRNFTPYTSNTTSGDLFCVYFDRYSSRNYFVTPSIDATSSSSVSAAIATYETSYSFGALTSTIDPASVRTTYKVNVPVQVQYTSNLTGFLAHPRPGNSPDCNYASPALFLDSSASVCSWSVTNNSCQTDSSISLYSFVSNFAVARQPTVLNARPSGTDLVNVTQGTVTCLDADGVNVNCTDLVPEPSLNMTTSAYCANVLSQLTYNIKYVSGTGITEVTYDAVLRTVLVTTTYNLQQKFAFNYNFSSSSSADPYPRSGNPGYLVGRPLIAGRVNSTSSSVTVNPDPNTWVTLPVVSSDGSCAATNSRGQPVLFGENLRTSCTRTITWNATSGSLAPTCDSINSAVRDSLVGMGISGNMSLATFGNSSSSQSGDWLQVISDLSCTPTVNSVPNGCTSMILNARLQVLVAKAGSASNPQSKLVGARLTCDQGPVLFQCATGSCEAVASNKFLSTYTVSFVDVTSDPLEGAKQKPVYLLRLPTDFFYPLYSYSSASSLGPVWQLWALCLAAVCTAWRASQSGPLTA